MKELPKPGTKEAVEQGQAFQGLYWYNENCKLHGGRNNNGSRKIFRKK